MNTPLKSTPQLPPEPVKSCQDKTLKHFNNGSQREWVVSRVPVPCSALLHGVLTPSRCSQCR
ncbi:hypothetical protein E2C01_069694 [Portunus trituberculatus]|uniref:Uncharacterized protein n=1 Tax=Portunus trituberculatus TaxID=210409 RepID=A0A5B7I306_PORTR|nr:hypothetical protein [Portunus trituberculatus]